MDKPHDNILVTGPYIAYQSVGTQFVGGTHTHNYPTPDTPHAADHRLVEDIDFEDISEAPRSTDANATYPFVVPAKLTELELYSLAEFETMYREAAAKDAPDFAHFLKHYHQLGALDFGRRNKKQIFEVLQAFFHEEIQYKYNNFIYYF